MKSFSVAAITAAASVVSASPILKRQDLGAPNVTDVEILNFALFLEHLEDNFYREGITNFTQQDFLNAGFADPFWDNLLEISADESTHVEFLTSAIGDGAVAECTYNFPYVDPASFVALASVLEGVGVSAYLGAAAEITSGEYLTAAGAILTVEARHSAVLRLLQGESPFPQPFDDPLDFDEVYSLLPQFIASCPSVDQKPPFKDFPPLTVATTVPPTTIQTGDLITLLTPDYTLRDSKRDPIYVAFITLQFGSIFVKATAVDGGFCVEVPQGINGQSYAVLVSCDDAVNDDTILAGPAIVEIENDLEPPS